MTTTTDERLSNMLARLERERQEGGEDVHVSRAEARAIYKAAFRWRKELEDAGDQGDGFDRLTAIITKMGSVGWPG